MSRQQRDAEKMFTQMLDAFRDSWDDFSSKQDEKKHKKLEEERKAASKAKLDLKKELARTYFLIRIHVKIFQFLSLSLCL